MAKRPDPKEAYTAFLGDAHKADEKPTESTQSQQKAYRVPTAGTLKAYRVRIPENWWEEMTEHFKAQGKRPSEGLREIIRDYLERNH